MPDCLHIPVCTLIGFSDSAKGQEQMSYSLDVENDPMYNRVRPYTLQFVVPENKIPGIDPLGGVYGDKRRKERVAAVADYLFSAFFCVWGRGTI